MTTRAYNVLDGMGEAMLALARKHSTPQQWGSWLKVKSMACVQPFTSQSVLGSEPRGGAIGGKSRRRRRVDAHRTAAVCSAVSVPVI